MAKPRVKATSKKVATQDTGTGNNADPQPVVQCKLVITHIIDASEPVVDKELTYPVNSPVAFDAPAIPNCEFKMWATNDERGENPKVAFTITKDTKVVMVYESAKEDEVQGDADDHEEVRGQGDILPPLPQDDDLIPKVQSATADAQRTLKDLLAAIDTAKITKDALLKASEISAQVKPSPEMVAFLERGEALAKIIREADAKLESREAKPADEFEEDDDGKRDEGKDAGKAKEAEKVSWPVIIAAGIVVVLLILLAAVL